VKRTPPALVGLGLALVASQAGHLVAYQLRYGEAAYRLQASGAHLYFPAIVKAGLGLAAVGMLVALALVGFARLAAGRPIRGDDAPPFVRLLAILFSLQLTFFVVQEVLESAVTGGTAGSPAVLLLWGTAGQLPVAVVGALALRWLLVRVAPALDQLSLRVDLAWRPAPFAAAPVMCLVAADAAPSTERLTHAFNRRGPPS
jgi:hypothetical protein